MTDVELVRRAKALLDQLTEKPRFAGSAEESRARSLCRTELESAGFACVERPFEFSEWPARWGPPLAAGVQVMAVVILSRLAAGGHPITAAAIAAIVVAALGAVGGRIRRKGVLTLPYSRSRSVNLEATRGEPTVWLVAHIDSKSQTVPMLVRIASALAVQAVSLLFVAALAASAMGRILAGHVWLSLEIGAVAVGLPTILCFVGNASPGAVDNATGVVASLLAAAHPDSPRDLGVLITSGEELGLAGARAWAAGASVRIKVINCDTVDDGGGWRCMYSGERPAGITSTAVRVARQLGVSLKVRSLIPGILADNVAFADVRVEAVTISRGNFSTLARIHTWRDTSIAQTGRGSAEAGVLLATLAKELR
ncbi:MAG TPA: M28 family peptidase [Gemmatimonadaceae bacterium]